jgi:glycosyltransferase involved in cell wall biosynthesis
MPLKILHVSYIYPPKLKVADGITNVVYNVTKELARRGHQVTVFTSNLADLHTTTMLPTGHYIVNGVSVFYFRFLWRYKTFMFTPSIINGLRNLDNFDIIHIHDARSFQGICTYFWDKIKQVPYVFQPHGSFLTSISEPYSLKMLKLYLDKLVSSKIVKNASKIIALSGFEAKQYKHIGIPEEKITIIPNGIDLSKYTELPPKGAFKRKFNIPENRKIILYLGRIHKIKGIDILVKAYAYLKNEMNFKDAVLVIAGPDDGYLSEAKALAYALRISDSTMFVGPLYSVDKLAAYVDSDLFVLPSRYEAFPMVVLEAYACGKPVIASNVGGLKELIIDGETGLLFKAGNFKQMAEKMAYLLNDNDKAIEIGRKARILVEEKYSIDKVVDIIEGLYSEVAL